MTSAIQPKPPEQLAWGTWVSSNSKGVRLARWHMASQLADAGFDRDVVRDIEQIAGELIANAVLHGCRGVGLARLRVTAQDDGLLVEVFDPSPARPSAVVSRPDAESGRGLLMVEALADEWGVVDHGGSGKTVWARCTMRREVGERDAGGQPC
ncbi:ATP-binding protein [Peterkaempfera bronchialis]|uniref:ATP-binding protein n=1 Tax=Peterkaempfera bronchialis TaxID=2126346 RepID=UPI003C304BA3